MCSKSVLKSFNVLIFSDDTRLSTSTFHSPEGTVLYQYNVMVCGLAVCLNFNCIFYIDLTEPPKHSKQSTVEQRLLRIRDVLENTASTKVLLVFVLTSGKWLLVTCDDEKEDYGQSM